MLAGTSQSGKGIGTFLAPVLMAHCLLAQTGTSTEANREVRPPEEAQVQPAGYVPVTQNERLRYYFGHMFSAEPVLRSAAGAGISQALNTPAEWRQGAEGYGRRFASSYGQHIIQSTVMYGASAVLHEDNRYFRCGQSGFGARFKYSIESAFLARHDDGSRHLSLSRMSGYIAAAAISRKWEPPSTDQPIHSVNAFGIAIGVATGFNVAREFLPRIFHSRPPVAINPNPAH